MSCLQMSLFYPLTHSFQLWPEAYDCPKIFESNSGTQRRVYGVYLGISGVIFLAFYIPCFIALLKIKTKTPAYQLMRVLAVLDILSLTVNSLITGFLAFTGTHYCQQPLFSYFSGGIGNASWMTGCLASVLLGMERCTEVNANFLLSFLFKKQFFRVVMLVLGGYGFFAYLFSKPGFFNPECSCWLFDPLIGKDPSLYINLLHASNNLVVAVLTTSLYFYLCYYLLFKYGYTTSMWLYKSKRQIVLQGVILCFFHSSAALIYEYVQFFHPPQWLIMIGHLVWQFSSGCLSILYLTLNRTIRNSVLKMALPKAVRKRFGLYIGVEEHLALEKALEHSGHGGVAVINKAGVHVKFDNFLPG